MMAISTFDMFKIGIGPSSSHTVGPMRAACLFVARCAASVGLPAIARVRCELFGSLGATGRGHGSDRAVLLGLQGLAPDTIDPDEIEGRLAQVTAQGGLPLGGTHFIRFIHAEDLLFHRRRSLPLHPNGMTLQALAADGTVLESGTYYSIGGGFVIEPDTAGQPALVPDTRPLPYPFIHGADLLRHCRAHRMTIAQIMWAHEEAWRPKAETKAGLLQIWQVMQDCVQRGLATEGVLPGGLKVRRRAVHLYRSIRQRRGLSDNDPLEAIDWVNLYALAVNEENAAGGRVVTAPTNGAAGIIPAVLHYYRRFVPGADDQGVMEFLLTAAAIAILYKQNASISGAEVGCQGEVGVACSMAAAGLCAVMGGTPEQVENAAEIGMEHHLGLTCDPVGGLVQIPCIERNAIGSVKAINAARMALRGDGQHHVSLDKVIKTMRETGADMKNKYKETSRGGLAVNVIEC